MNILLALCLVLFEAVYEAMAQRGKKTIAGVIEFFYHAGVAFIIFSWSTGYFRSGLINDNFWFILFGYVLIRFALFDVVYNLICKNPVFYIGSTKLYDKMFSWFFRWSGIAPNHFLFMFKLIALLIGFTWLMK